MDKNQVCEDVKWVTEVSNPLGDGDRARVMAFCDFFRPRLRRYPVTHERGVRWRGLGGIVVCDHISLAAFKPDTMMAAPCVSCGIYIAAGRESECVCRRTQESWESERSNPVRDITRVLERDYVPGALPPRVQPVGVTFGKAKREEPIGVAVGEVVAVGEMRDDGRVRKAIVDLAADIILSRRASFAPTLESVTALLRKPGSQRTPEEQRWAEINRFDGEPWAPAEAERRAMMALGLGLRR